MALQMGPFAECLWVSEHVRGIKKNEQNSTRGGYAEMFCASDGKAQAGSIKLGFN
jgi:hypothetical protein